MLLVIDTPYCNLDLSDADIALSDPDCVGCFFHHDAAGNPTLYDVWQGE